MHFYSGNSQTSLHSRSRDSSQSRGSNLKSSSSLHVHALHGNSSRNLRSPSPGGRDGSRHKNSIVKQVSIVGEEAFSIRQSFREIEESLLDVAESEQNSTDPTLHNWASAKLHSWSLLRSNFDSFVLKSRQLAFTNKGDVDSFCKLLKRRLGQDENANAEIIDELDEYIQAVKANQENADANGLKSGLEKLCSDVDEFRKSWCKEAEQNLEEVEERTEEQREKVRELEKTLTEIGFKIAGLIAKMCFSLSFGAGLVALAILAHVSLEELINDSFKWTKGSWSDLGPAWKEYDSCKMDLLQEREILYSLETSRTVLEECNHTFVHKFANIIAKINTVADIWTILINEARDLQQYFEDTKKVSKNPTQLTERLNHSLELYSALGEALKIYANALNGYNAKDVIIGTPGKRIGLRKRIVLWFVTNGH